MEKLNYSEVVQTILKNHVRNRPNSQTEVQVIFDTKSDRYQVLNIGWQDLTRITNLAAIQYLQLLPQLYNRVTMSNRWLADF